MNEKERGNHVSMNARGEKGQKRLNPNAYPVLTIAGSDSSGGAGIQTDLKTFTTHGCYGMSALTALTAQNTEGVMGVMGVPGTFLRDQIEAIISDIPPLAIKTGMLYDVECVRVVVDVLHDFLASGLSTVPIIVDPVSVSTSGHSLLAEAAQEVMIQELFPLATLVTPNVKECETILDFQVKSESKTRITSLQTLISAALCVCAPAVLVKGGHLEVYLSEVLDFRREHGEVEVFFDSMIKPDQCMEVLAFHSEKAGNRVVVDALAESKTLTTLFVRPFIDTHSTHGTGCTLSAAIASELARGSVLVEAVRRATVYTYNAILTAPGLGKGNGPLNHMHVYSSIGIGPRMAEDLYPTTRYLIESSLDAWKGFVKHKFVRELGEAVLERGAFRWFIVQDYHYLRYYARAYSLLAAKSSSFSGIAGAMAVVKSILEEIEIHEEMCREFGAEIRGSEESLATTAYGAYLLDIGIQGDASKLLIALLACLVGYGEVGIWLKTQGGTKGSGAEKVTNSREKEQATEDVMVPVNPYTKWILTYSGEAYQAAVRQGLETIESLPSPSSKELSEWEEVWGRCVGFETAFWEAAMTRGA